MDMGEKKRCRFLIIPNLTLHSVPNYSTSIQAGTFYPITQPVLIYLNCAGNLPPKLGQAYYMFSYLHLGSGTRQAHTTTDTELFPQKRGRTTTTIKITKYRYEFQFN